ERVGDEEILHFVAAKIEDERAPILMLAFARIFMFVEGGAVEAGERPIVAWKMRRDPIDDDADAGLVKSVNEKLEVFGRAVADGGSIEAGELVAPGRIKGVFGDGEEFDVRESHLLDISDERFGECTIAEGFAGILFAPGADVDFVDAEGRAKN